MINHYSFSFVFQAFILIIIHFISYGNEDEKKKKKKNSVRLLQFLRSFAPIDLIVILIFQWCSEQINNRLLVVFLSCIDIVIYSRWIASLIQWWKSQTTRTERVQSIRWTTDRTSQQSLSLEILMMNSPGFIWCSQSAIPCRNHFHQWYSCRISLCWYVFPFARSFNND